jgi:SAM-dependent methyltransferase
MGFTREQLRGRYDVGAFSEDPWHEYCGEQTSKIVSMALAQRRSRSNLLLNAGSGVYRLEQPNWEEICVDLFDAPLANHTHAVRASVEALPLQECTFGAVVCVGEVLGYCDPQLAFKEFARILEDKGILVCDFGNSLSFRHKMRACYARAADIVTDEYNGTEERVWVYNPRFIKRLLESSGFSIRQQFGTHTWSAAAHRFGMSKTRSTLIQRSLHLIPFPRRWADVCTIIAERTLA